jgi:hypothetical protein
MRGVFPSCAKRTPIPARAGLTPGKVVADCATRVLGFVEFFAGWAMSEAEMAANLVDTALVAAIIDHKADGVAAPDGHTHETACLNCGTTLTGPFCCECGQTAHVHRTLGAFFHDLLHGVFHFEGRIWHTLPLLLLHPGQLTRRYIDGQRARFVSPLALFLFCVFLMFAVIQQTTHSNLVTIKHNGKVLADRPAVEAQLAQLDQQRRALVARHGDTSDVDSDIQGLRTGLAFMAPDSTAGWAEVSRQAPQVTRLAWVDAIIARVRDNPALVAYKVQMHAYKYSWLLIPISVPFVWLLFPFGRRFPVYDHTVFVTYSLSFMTLLLVVTRLLGSLGLEAAGALMLFVPPLHMYRQLRGTYDCSPAGALARTAALMVFAGIALLIFAGLIIAQSTD